MNIIGLGSGANRLVQLFSAYSQYNVYRIGTNLVEDSKTKNLPIYNSPEEYEDKCPDLTQFFSPIKEEVLFVLIGSPDISGATLRILEYVKDCQISVLYVRPDLNLLSNKKLVQEKILYNVLQEYARSGLFYKLYLVDNTVMEENIGDIPLTTYHSKINEMIVSTLHMINVYKHNEPLLLTDTESSNISRIGTFGFADLKTGKETLFSKLENTTNKFYIYSLNKDLVEKDGKLLVRIKSQVKEKAVNGVKCGFAIYQNDYGQNYVYVESSTHILQGTKLTST